MDSRHRLISKEFPCPTISIISTLWTLAASTHTIDPSNSSIGAGNLHCTESELKDGLAKVGDHVTAVRNQLALCR